MQGRYEDAFAGLATLQNLGSRAALPTALIHLTHALISARVGRYNDAASDLDRARQLGRELGDMGTELDTDLFAAMLAVERGDNAHAIEYANLAAEVDARARVEIMRARRSALAQLIGGIAEIRAGRIDASRNRESAIRRLNASGDPIQASWQQALAGEIALAEGRLDDAESAFRAAEYQINSSFAIYPAAVTIANNLPFRDGLARTALARGDVPRAINEYRRLNRPDITSKWTSAFEPRFVLAIARIAARSGDTATARAEYAGFLKLWNKSDEGLPELKEARRYIR
jgi:tetratricopeptide (TPR) repeat protein